MIREDDWQRARELLMRDEEQNRYPLLRLNQGGIGACWISGQSVCLWDKEHDKYCFAVHSADELLELYGVLRPRQGSLVSLVTDSRWVDVLLTLEPPLSVSRCTQLQAASYKGQPPAVPGVTFGGVTRQVAEWMMEVYDHPELSVEFILRRAAAAPAVAAFSPEGPVGCFLTHSAAELGPVYVSPDYRGSGLADALYAAMSHRLGDTAAVLFVYPENQASQKWLRRMGCVPAPKEAAWFWRE